MVRREIRGCFPRYDQACRVNISRQSAMRNESQNVDRLADIKPGITSNGFLFALDLSESVAGSMVDLDSLVEDNTYEDTSLDIQTMKVLKAIYNCLS